MMFRLIKGLTLATLAGIASACTHHVPLEANWSYVESSERAPPGVVRQGIRQIGTPSSTAPSSDGSPTRQEREINRLNEIIARQDRNIRQLEAEIKASETQEERDPPVMRFFLHNPSEKTQIIRCVYLAFQPLGDDTDPPQDCTPTPATSQDTKSNAKSGEIDAPGQPLHPFDPTKYAFLGDKWTLRPGDTIPFTISHENCPVPTHVVLISDGSDNAEILKELWARKRQTVIVQGEYSGGYIRDSVRRNEGVKGTGC